MTTKPKGKKTASTAKIADILASLKTPEMIPIGDLKPHPQNYHNHPDDQIEHIMASMRGHGFYRNVVTANDLTILIGHGSVEAAKRLNLTDVPVVRMPYKPDEPRAIKLLVADNEIGHLAERDDRMLTELLKRVHDEDSLLGSGYDDAMLMNLLYVTRTDSEIKDFDAAAEWVGLPGYENAPDTYKLVINFRDDQVRAKFIEEKKVEVADREGRTIICWYPPKKKENIKALRYED